MRGAFLVVGVLAWSFAASAQEAGPSGALGALRLGMSVEEAQAAAPSWHPIPNELGVIQVSVRNAALAGATYNLRLNFESGRLLNIRAARHAAYDGEQPCWTEFEALLAAAESGFGPLDEIPREPSAQQQSRGLPSGSNVTTERDPNGRYAWSYAWRKAPRINVSASVYPSAERMACYLAASAFSESLWEELTPAVAPPDDIGSAPFSEAVLRPAGNDVSRFYPSIAMSLDIEGRVELHCLIIEGAPPRCVVVREAPLGLGFGEAALRIAARASVAPEHGGEPTAGRRIRSYIRFQLAD